MGASAVIGIGLLAAGAATAYSVDSSNKNAAAARDQQDKQTAAQNDLINQENTQQQTQASAAAAVVARDAARQRQIQAGSTGAGFNNTIMTSPTGTPIGNAPGSGGKTILGS